MVKMYLVRHAEAQGNILEFFQGHTDCDLTEKGLKQLDMLSLRFRNVDFDAVYTSPLIRAVKTAEAVNRFKGLPIVTDRRLIEINGGVWEGRNWTDIERDYPEDHAIWRNTPWEFAPPDGEPMESVYERIKDALADIAAHNNGKTVVVVSHGCSLKNFLAYAEFGDIKRLNDMGWSDNTAVSLIEFDDNMIPKIIYKNDSSHLPCELSTLAFSRWVKE
ncbi:MAG: histidine phosphatase family protein [Oscillospiraceae bacterium]